MPIKTPEGGKRPHFAPLSRPLYVPTRFMARRNQWRLYRSLEGDVTNSNSMFRLTPVIVDFKPT